MSFTYLPCAPHNCGAVGRSHGRAEREKEGFSAQDYQALTAFCTKTQGIAIVDSQKGFISKSDRWSRESKDLD